MAKKKAAAKKQKSFEEALWDSANKLRDTLLPKLISCELSVPQAEQMMRDEL